MLFVYQYRLLRAQSSRGGLVQEKLLAHKMASVTEKVSEEKVSHAEETTETKKHRGIPEALFLVSIYHFTVGVLTFV